MTTDVMYSDVWRWSAQTALPPNNGQVRSESSDWTSATELFIAKLSDAGTDTTDALAAIVAGDGIYLRHKTDPSRWAQFQATDASANASTFFSIPVSYQDGGGTLPNSSTQIVVELLVPGADGGNLADWTMEQTDGTRWLSSITCPHGQTTSGVWLDRPVVDDRNFVDQAEPTFANHQGLHPDCDCVLNLAWSPSFLPPTPPEPEPVVEALLEPAATTGGATFSLWRMYPKLYGGTIVCQHGWTQSGVWMGATDWPISASVQAAVFENHRRLFGCTDVVPPPIATASAGFAPVTGVPRTTQVALSQVPGTTGPAFTIDSFGRLSVTAGGLLTVSATFSLFLSVPNGGGGAARLRLPPKATANLTAGQVASVALGDVDGHATGVINYAAPVVAGTSIEVDYVNISGFIQDVQGGTLTVSLT